MQKHKPLTAEYQLNLRHTCFIWLANQSFEDRSEKTSVEEENSATEGVNSQIILQRRNYWPQYLTWFKATTPKCVYNFEKLCFMTQFQDGVSTLFANRAD